MKNLNILLQILLLTIISSCSEKKNNASNDVFNLVGVVKNIPDDSWIFLMNNGKSEDSTQIKNEKFSFKGNLNEPAEYDLFINDTRDYTRIWLEFGNVSFESQKGDFKNAKISGSESQTEYEKLWEPIYKYRAKRDSLNNIYRDKSTNDSLKKVAYEELQKVYDDHLKIETDFISNNPNSYVSVATLDFYTTTFGKAKSKELFEGLSEEVKNSSYGKSIQRYLELNSVPKIGDRYVDFAMNNQFGEKVQISDFDGEIVLLDFWASWCGPCIKEYPALREAYSKYRDIGFEIVGISQDQTKESWVKAIKSENLEWVNLWEEGGNKTDPHLIYGINGIPDNFLIDRNGFVIARNLRGSDLIEKIDEIINIKTSL